MKLHQVFGQVLFNRGIDTMFGLLGEANMMMVDAFVRAGGRYVNPPREDGAVLAAFGYGHASGRLGVATVTHGPALTNTVTALTEASRNRVPLLLIAGDTAVDVRMNPQDIDQFDVIRPTGAGFQQVRTAQTALDDLATAIRRAFAESRPIVLNVPIDIQAQDSAAEPSRYAPPAFQRPQPDPDALDRALGVAASSRRPVILAGHGAVRSGAKKDLLKLAAVLGAPVATTLKAKDLFRGDPYDLGLFGSLSSALTGQVIGQADCVLAFGAGLNQFTAAGGALFKGKGVVHVDTDPARIGQWWPVDAAVVGDASTVATAMTGCLIALEREPSAFRSQELADRIAAWKPSDEFEDASGGGTVDLRSFTVWLDQVLPRDRNLVTDVGRYVAGPLLYLHVADPSACLSPLGFGSVGVGLGAAIGVAVARPDAPTVIGIGDGGLMMSLAEFNTAVRYGLDLIAIVYNDGSYSAEYHHFAKRGMDTSLSMFDWPDLATLANALGGQGVAATSMDDLDHVVDALQARDRPLLIDVRVDPAVRIGFYD